MVDGDLARSISYGAIGSTSAPATFAIATLCYEPERLNFEIVGFQSIVCLKPFVDGRLTNRKLAAKGHVEIGQRLGDAVARDLHRNAPSRSTTKSERPAWPSFRSEIVR